ncbi:MAG TPA: hypothetical protein VGL98_05535 [Gammaproteobacteria bacterium]
MWRTTLRAFAWIAGAVSGLAVATYVAAIAVNRSDRPPSPDALRFVASYEGRAPLADDANAYIYLLGFDAPLNDDPGDVGARRLAWFRSTGERPVNLAHDPQTTHLGYLSTDPVVEGFLTACADDSRECALAFADGDVAFQAWNAASPWLLERYLELIEHSGWREEVFDLSRPLPSYAPVMHGQRLLILQAKVLADNGDTRAASELLAKDARFWRMVLASSDLLITKMIATAALWRHFEWGSLAVRSFPSGSVASALPNEWHQPMIDAELSLRRTLVGEWIFFSSSPVMLDADLDFPLEETSASRTSDRLLRPLFKPQDTLNRHATFLRELADALDAPLADYDAATDRASLVAWQLTQKAYPPRSLYNIVGSLALAPGGGDYGAYAYRVGDIEGMRRAALATALLRDSAASGSDPEKALAASPLRNPYDDEPLRWDADEKAVVFVGLEPGERGEHRFYY